MGGVKHIGQILGHVHVQLVPSDEIRPLCARGSLLQSSILSSVPRYCTTHYSALLYFTVLSSTLLYSTPTLLYSTLPYSTPLYSTLLSQWTEGFRDTSLLSTHKPLITYTYLTCNLLYIIYLHHLKLISPLLIISH